MAVPAPSSAAAETSVRTRLIPVAASVWPPPVLPLAPDAVPEEPLELPLAAVVPDPELPPVVVGVVELAAPTTTIVPCMNGWILQKYENVPA